MSHILTPPQSTPTQNLSHKQNLLLAALPQKDYERLQPSLELVALSQGWSVYENGGELDLVYFPTSSVISLLTVSDKGEAVKIAAIGKEGVFGISMLIGTGNSNSIDSSVTITGSFSAKLYMMIV